jgi:hypothetical protein
MQTANGPVELDSEISFWLKKLKQKVNAVVGGDTPDLLSVGYRCKEFGFGFHWDPRSVPYFVLPDGTEVDLHVDHYVPYLFDDGDVTINRAACSYEIPHARSEFLPSHEALYCQDAHIDIPAFDTQYYDISDSIPMCVVPPFPSFDASHEDTRIPILAETTFAPLQVPLCVEGHELHSGLTDICATPGGAGSPIEMLPPCGGNAHILQPITPQSLVDRTLPHEMLTGAPAPIESGAEP